MTAVDKNERKPGITSRIKRIKTMTMMISTLRLEGDILSDYRIKLLELGGNILESEQGAGYNVPNN